MPLRRIAKLFTIATVTALCIRLFIFEDYRIVSGSMYPSLWAGDLIFVSKSTYNVRLPFSSYEVLKFQRPVHGDVVAFSVPERGLETFVKRVIGLEGDVVEIKDNVLLINNKPADYSALNVSTPPLEIMNEKLSNGKLYRVQMNPSKKINFGPVDVPKGHFFVLGDNRSDSVDSRSWGPVPYSNLKGSVRWVWLSVDPASGIRSGRFATTIQ